MMPLVHRLAVALLGAPLALTVAGGTIARAAEASPIEHVVIVLQENRSFDNMFHGYPGANYATTAQTSTGATITLRPTPLMVPWDPAHHYSNWVADYNGGAMNGFDREDLDLGSGAPPNFAYTYVRKHDVQPYWDLAREGVLADEMFSGHRSQSFAGHLYPVAAASGPIDPQHPNYYASEGPTGGQTCFTPGTGPAINLDTGAEDETYTSCLDIPTLADLLDRKQLSWKFYTPFVQRNTYMTSFAVIKRIAESSEFTQNVVSPETTIIDDAEHGRLPAVAWVMGNYKFSDHAGQDVPSSNGPTWVTTVFNAIGRGPEWKNTVIILVYDDWGGWYDHVKPVTFNAFEPGFRLPMVIVSPYAKRGYISHRMHDMGSIIHFVERNWHLGSLHRSDAYSDALGDCFDYRQTPLRYRAVRPPGTYTALFMSDLAPAIDPEVAD